MSHCSPRATATARACQRPAPRRHADERGQHEEAEAPLPAPSADRRRGSMVAQSHAGPAEVMYVREYNRGREIRTTPLQGAEVIAMLTSLVGENQAMSKRKV